MKIGEAQEQAVLREYDRSGSIRRSARAAGVSFNAAKRVILGRGLKMSTMVDIPTPGADLIRQEGETTGSVEFASDKPIRTLEDALAYAEVDLAVWRVKKWECAGWQTAMKVREELEGRKLDTPVIKQLWRVKLFLERIVSRTEKAALDGLFERLATHSDRVLPLIQPHNKPPHLMVVDLVDAHFGKLAWAPETGQNYDLKIADQIYRAAVRDILMKAQGFHIEEFLVPLGSDFLHIDNSGGTTTAGTPQDVDGRLAKILEVAESAVVWAVEELADKGNVILRWVPGNHDRVLSYCLARTIKAWFRNNARVQVDIGPSSRKYHRYHKTLIGMTHGDEEKHSVLPIIMATECPTMWSETTCREWHVGHLHKSKRLDHLGLDTHGGVPVRTLRSLSAADAWHYRKGFVGTQRAAEAFLYSREGWVGHFISDVAPEHQRGAA